ncbi:MAG: nucleoside hydrolase [Clostridia bacterium]
MKTPVIFDVDTGIDDAVAILLAEKSKKFNIKFFCSSAGNTSAKNGAKNTLDVLELIAAPQIDVLVGSESGFKRTRTKRSAHGKSGLGDYVFPKNPRKLCKDGYIKRYECELMAAKKPMSIVALGPLTNIAKVVQKCPKVKEKIKDVWFMGSTFDAPVGEKPYAGFNVACDPEAVEYLLKQGIKIVFCPNNFGREFYLTPANIEKIAQSGKVGAVLAEIFRGYKDNFIKNGAAMYDSTAVFAFLNKRACKIKGCFMEIKYYPALDTALAIPHFGAKNNNAQIIVKMNGNKMKKGLFGALK